jgi:GT2 family glycosyltransferase
LPLPPRVSIVVPCYNKREYTERCLAALVRNTPDAPATWEAIFVDNASTDGTGEWLRGLASPQVRALINLENVGFARACNQGAVAARGRYVLFLNNDTEPFENWLSPLVETLESAPGAGIVGSKLLYPDGTVQHAGMVVKPFLPGELIRWDHLYRRCPPDAAVVNRTREFQAVTGAALLMPRALFDALGGFDEGYVNGWEDVDLCLRVREAGKRVYYEPRSALLHHESVTPGRFDRERPNAERFLQKWAGRVTPDETEKLREDGQDELAQLVAVQLMLRAQLLRHVAVPDLFPGGHQPMLLTGKGWRGKLRKLRLAYSEQREMQLALFQCMEALGSLLSRRPLDTERRASP